MGHPAGSDPPLTDVGCPRRIRRLGRWSRSCTSPAGRRDLIGACARGPVTVLSASSRRRVPTLFGASEKDDGSSMTAKKRHGHRWGRHSRPDPSRGGDRPGRRELADREFPATAAGYRDLLAWLRTGPARSTTVGVEGTGAYGAGLTRYLTGRSIMVVEVDRPDRKTRRSRASPTRSTPSPPPGRPCPAGQRHPEDPHRPVEAIRALRVARRGAVKARTAASTRSRALVTAAPEPCAPTCRPRRTNLIDRCAALRRDAPDSAIPRGHQAALRRLARRAPAPHRRDHRPRPATRPAVAAPPHPARCPRRRHPTSPGSCWSPPATTPTGSAPKPPSPSSAAPHRSRQLRTTDRHRLNRGGDRRQRRPLPHRPRAACAATTAPAPTSSAAPPKASPSARSSAASSATSPARSTPSSPTQRSRPA